MKKPDKIRVLLFCNEFDSALSIRQAAVNGGLELEMVQVASRQEFVGQLEEQRPSLILLGQPEGKTCSLPQVLETVEHRVPGVPVVVLGYADTESSDLAAAMDAIRTGATDYLHRSHLDRLPLILERASRDEKTGPTNERLRHEVQQATDTLRESQKLVTIGRLAGSIAHEINNPLESVTNLLYLLNEDETLSDQARDYVTLAQRELARVAQIAKQTLNFYRDTPQPVRTRPSDLLDEVLVLYSRRIAEKQLRVVREFETSRSMTASPGEMRQVFSNLITNAIEASEHGGTLRLRVSESRQWRGRTCRGLRISIADTGSGIGKEARLRIGEPFFTTKGQLGTGLGLWVTKSIIQRYGGTMQVSSSTRPVGHGTVFSIFLPGGPRLQSVVAINEAPSNDRSTGHAGGGASSAPSFGSGGSSRNHPRLRSEYSEYAENGTE
jgi:two-component system, NtrC family, sensor kinase